MKELGAKVKTKLNVRIGMQGEVKSGSPSVKIEKSKSGKGL